MIRLALLRHGHTSWNREGRIQGRTDIPLDPEAEAHLKSLRLPAPWDEADLVSSPLSRAVRTAEILTARAPRTEPALLEMDWGAWEGGQGTALRADPESGYRDLESWGWNFTPPGGESPATLRDRLVPWAESLKSDTLAVCHIGTMRVLLACATAWQFDGPPPFRIKRDRLYILRIHKGDWQLEEAVPRLERQAS
ncbi:MULTISPECIES: histidine phosphatase family protein [unclassified Sulfitobacter]|uniref:histidine phosphatase family protein n=1 Tax=unclassified Sulfitobacter TaxID=196795 RepID=UPI0007C3EE1D|nr:MULTISPECIES: histidine phosphatase family protein [unclassified Sulfitobacter]KZY05112.1 phosphoglycerate mutase [Sulfitobacter sp. HI0023]KZY27251.1 phosphoglycerate mutase [Sulfitobacter sp. HI0040]KZZ68639.1 phosphoglycerate mutase [Sulfitobacter sp. HI0129]